MTSTVVRPAIDDDIPGMLALFEEVAAEGRWIGSEAPIDRAAKAERWRATIAAEDEELFVAELEGRLVGMADVRGTGPTYLGMLVAEGFRGRGIGTHLLRVCLGWAVAAGSHKVWLEVWPHNEPAIRLYEKLGFVREGYLTKQWRRRNGELWDAVVMGRLLV